MGPQTGPNGITHRGYEYSGPLAIFQLNVARRWYRRGTGTDDTFAQFFFFYTGLNALYFLWAKLDRLTNERGELPNEGKQIEHLVGKIGEDAASRVLDTTHAAVEYFLRRPPIQEMRKRDVTEDVGDVKQGRRFRNKLQKGEMGVDRLVGLAQILYLVRSNLFHGSKAESGDDKEVVIASVPVLRELLREALLLTSRNTL